MGFCGFSMFCCALPYVHSSCAIILMGKRELVALLSLSSWCLVIIVLLFLAVPWVCQQFVIVEFPDHTHLLLFLSVHSYFEYHFVEQELNYINLIVFLLSCGCWCSMPLTHTYCWLLCSIYMIGIPRLYSFLFIAICVLLV